MATEMAAGEEEERRGRKEGKKKKGEKGRGREGGREGKAKQGGSTGIMYGRCIGQKNQGNDKHV